MFLKMRKVSKGFTVEVDSIGHPLPPPPVGTVWHRRRSGSWELHDCAEKSKSCLDSDICGNIVKEVTSFQHTVMPDDTLQGICLRYRTSVQDIRRMNCFSGNSIQFKKILFIPIRKGVQVQMQENTHDVLIQKFKNATGESAVESRIYLEESEWNVESAIEKWNIDDNWEKGNYLDAIRQGICDPSADTQVMTGGHSGGSSVELSGVMDRSACTDRVVESTHVKVTMFARSVDSSIVNDGLGSWKVGEGGRSVAPIAIKTPVEVAPVSVFSPAGSGDASTVETLQTNMATQHRQHL